MTDRQFCRSVQSLHVASRRAWLILTLAVALIVTGTALPVVARQQVTIKDIAGRTVEVQLPVQRMLLSEGRFLPSIAILDRENPIQRIAGMMGEFKQYDPTTYAQYRNRFPEIENIPIVGQGGAASFSVEAALAAAPDVAIFGLSSGHGPGAKSHEVIEKLAAAGVPVVVIDFRIDPLVNTPKSIELLGRLMGQQEEAAAFLSFYEAQLGVVRDRLSGVEQRPTVFIESRVGLREACCEAMGRQMMGRLIDWAGGRNLVGDAIPGTHGMVSIEYLLANQPDVYVGTAIGAATTSKQPPGRIVLGARATRTEAHASLRQAAARNGISQLDAVKSGRAYAIWHHFYNTPMNVVAVQAMAKWLHPTLFADLSPSRTVQTYFDRFQPFPLDGVYWVGLAGAEP